MPDARRDAPGIIGDVDSQFGMNYGPADMKSDMLDFMVKYFGSGGLTGGSDSDVEQHRNPTDAFMDYLHNQGELPGVENQFLQESGHDSTGSGTYGTPSHDHAFYGALRNWLRKKDYEGGKHAESADVLKGKPGPHPEMAHDEGFTAPAGVPNPKLEKKK